MFNSIFLRNLAIGRKFSKTTITLHQQAMGANSFWIFLILPRPTHSENMGQNDVRQLDMFPRERFYFCVSTQSGRVDYFSIVFPFCNAYILSLSSHIKLISVTCELYRIHSIIVPVLFSFFRTKTVCLFFYKVLVGCQIVQKNHFQKDNHGGMSS